MNEKINVELITPSEKEKILNDKNELEWMVNINAGEKIIIPLKFVVKFPADNEIFGLE